MATATRTLALVDIRDAAATALASQADTDPIVYPDIVDSLVPPAIMLAWGEPWLLPGVEGRNVMGPCVWTAALWVYCLVGRADPGSGQDQLDVIVAQVIDRLGADPAYDWPPATVFAPRLYDFSGVPCVGARVAYNVPTSI